MRRVVLRRRASGALLVAAMLAVGLWAPTATRAQSRTSGMAHHGARKHVFDVVSDFGAVGDNATDNTAAFAKAMAAVAAVADDGGGEVYVPAGAFKTAPFNLTNHSTLFLERGAAVVAIPDASRWPIIPPMPSYGQGRNHPGPRHTSFVHGQSLADVAIGGNNGTIDAAGPYWWTRTNTITRGHLFECIDCTDLTVAGVTLQKSPFWTVHPVYSDRITVSGVTILNAHDSHMSVDGFDPDSCTNVVLEDSYISTGDSGVAIKSGWDCFGVAFNRSSHNIYIRNVTVTTPHAAGVSIGSEMSGGVFNVTVEDSLFVDCSEGIKIKAGTSRGGYIRDAVYRNVEIVGTKTAIKIEDTYGDKNPSCPKHYEPPLPVMDTLVFTGVTGRDNVVAYDFEGLKGSPATHVALSHVQLDNTTALPPFVCKYVSGTAEDVSPPACPELVPPSAPPPLARRPQAHARR